MSNDDQMHQYLTELTEQFNSGHAAEHAYRPALQRLMESFEGVRAVNDPKRSEHGAPDFVFIRQANVEIIIGYAEAKDIAIDLDKVEKSNQMDRYRGYANLLLTNYLEFRFYKNGQKYATVSLGEAKDGYLDTIPVNSNQLKDELQAFLEQTPETIKSGRRLAEIMGGKARRIKENATKFLGADNIDSTELEKIFKLMRRDLIHDLSVENFADMYAQTLVYGLFVARYMDKTPDDFSRTEARDLIPKTNPFLRQFFDHIAGPDFLTSLGYIVDELCEVFRVSDIPTIIHKHLHLQLSMFGADELLEKDPIIHFYEDFLQEYDPVIRKGMGAYYTPLPVVRYIIQKVDEVLKNEFGIVDGLASNETVMREVETQPYKKDGGRKLLTTDQITEPRVQILDPAVGTATFLNETIKYIHKTFANQEGRWPAYVNDNLMKRLYGFEIMMAPYTIAHLKLGITLMETGADPDSRLGVYLTNTLEEGIPHQLDMFSLGLTAAVAEESQLAAQVKSHKPVMIVMGNPPYSGESQNKTGFAMKLVEKYKFEPGGQVKLQERNPKWINDDYVKFIAFAEEMIDKNGSGVVAMITNHGYLENPTFRGMRWHLARTFDKIYVLDLHGNSKKKEVAPDGGKDENVFSIMQGVAIIIAAKTSASTELAEVYHSEIYGTRQQKYSELHDNKLAFTTLDLDNKMLYFVQKNTEGKSEYEEGISISNLFPLNSVGIVTARDNLAIQFTYDDMWNTLDRFASLEPEQARVEFCLGKDVRDWTVIGAQTDIAATGLDKSRITKIAYRPLDSRYTYYTGSSRGFQCMARARARASSNFFAKNNLGIAFARSQKSGEYSAIYILDSMMEAKCAESSTQSYMAPLYIYHDDGTHTPNFNFDELKQLTANLSIEPSPEDILDYIYAILHSPSYRERYTEFLKTDFPRVPVVYSDDEFARLLPLGKRLREMHLMTIPVAYATTYPEPGTDTVDKISYINNRVYINDTQYFGNVPELAWNFYIGGYQPAQKWLKDRKGRKLTNNDLDHYQKIIAVLLETEGIMQQIG